MPVRRNPGRRADFEDNSGPVDGERVLFCAHADVGEDHIDISINACIDQPFHWYQIEGGDQARRKDNGDWFPVNWIAVCDACHISGKEPQELAAKDAPWVGKTPVIRRVN